MKLILLVEDNEINQNVAEGMLKALGYHVEIAENGQVALDLLQHGNIDLILMDCQMPVLDGYETAKSIRKLSSSKLKKTPIVALTAHALATDKARCLASGMDDYLAKPVSIADLKQILNRWIPSETKTNHG